MRLSRISKTYHNKHSDVLALNDISLDFNPFGMTFIMGPNDCGKTTLLNMIAGIEKFDSGQRLIEEVRIACIFQSYELIPKLTVLENIRMGADL